MSLTSVGRVSGRISLTTGPDTADGDLSDLSQPPRACRICGCGRLRPSYRLAEFRVVTCDECGYGMTVYTEIVSDNQERFRGGRWIETRGLMRSVTSAMAVRRYADLRAFDPGRDLIEVGCGTGEFLLAAAAAGHSVIGVDLSREVISHIRRWHPGLDVRRGTLETSGLPARSADVIAASHVLEHVADPIGLLIQMRRLLRPGGLVYIRVPNLDTWYRRVLGRNWWGFSVEHVGHFTADSVSRAFAAASLDVVAVRSGDSDPRHSLWPVLPLLLRRGVVLRSVGAALQPSAGQPSAGRAADVGARFGPAARLAAKRGLLGAYLGYRRTASIALIPLTRAQIARGGGPEIMVVGRAVADRAPESDPGDNDNRLSGSPAESRR